LPHPVTTLALYDALPIFVPLMQEENALVTEYEKLLAGSKIDWDGETLNLSLLTPYLKSKDPKIRRKACEKQNEFFLSIEDKLDEDRKSTRLNSSHVSISY